MPLILGKFSSRQFEIEFYDKDGHPLLSRKGVITDLPINTTLVENVNPHTFNYSSQEAQTMFDEQDKLIFDIIKQMFGLTYYDETFESVNREFSYTIFINPNVELNVCKPIPL